MMSASVGYLVIDSINPSALAPFWCAMLDTAVDTTLGEGDFLVLSRTADGLTVGFQRVTEHKTGKNRLHLDLVVADIDKATKEVEPAGAWSQSRGVDVAGPPQIAVTLAQCAS